MNEVFFALLVLVASLLLWWLRRTFTFWNDKGIAHLSFGQYLSFCYDLYTKPLHEVIRRTYAKHGRVYGSYQGTAPTLVVGDPEILREVLVSKFKHFSDRTEAQRTGSDVWRKSILNLSGDEWKKARNIFTPALNPARLKKIVVKISVIAEKVTSKVEEAATQGKPVNITELADHSSLDTTAALNYSVDLDSATDKEHPLIKCLEAIFSPMAGYKLIMLFLMPRVYKFLRYDYPPKASTDVFKAFVSHLIEDRRSKKKEEDDFLQVFMDAEYDWDNATDRKEQNAEPKRMSLDEITAQGIVFFVAGVESVAAAISFTAYFLALNPEVQDKVVAEVDKALSEGGLTYDTLQEMPYLDACIKESMRIITSDSMTMRLCTEETTVAGIHFKPGMCVDIPFAGIHHDPEYFPDPEKFNPERFLPENKDSVRPFTYIPFGAGPRNCVGMRLGLLQAKTTLASLLRRVRFETCTETMMPLKYKPRQLLPITDGPVLLRAVPRDSTEPKKEALSS
ncbi:cytochrome P450 3A41-like [Haemaphysalis longicornis]